MGRFYTQRFSDQLDRQVVAALSKPGMLMSHGILKPDAVSDPIILRQLVGPGVVQAMVVGADGNVFHSLVPTETGTNFTQLPGMQPAWISEALRGGRLFSTQEGRNTFHISLGPIQNSPNRGAFLFLFIKLRTTEIEKEKAALTHLFLTGSISAIVATSLAILLCFRFLINLRLRRVVAAIQRYETGDLSVRIPGPPSSDEIGILQQGVNDMAAQLADAFASLKKSLTELQTTEAARQETEENFRQLFESAPLPLLLLQGLAQTVLASNRAALDFLGPATAAAPSQALEVMVDDARRQQMRDLVQTQGKTDQFEAAIKVRDGQTRWVIFSALAIKYQSQPALLVGMADVTERKHAEEERLGLERKLQETQRLESLGVLAGGIAHDFNNLLTGIIGNASLARQDLPPDSSIQEYLEQIEKSSARAADLCRQMLAYSGKGRYIIKKVNLNHIIEETIHRFSGKGLAGFLQKPFNNDDLVAKIKSVLAP
jgi:PAS domain S-box-containing protein